jgi:hypothetical protein
MIADNETEPQAINKTGCPFVTGLLSGKQKLSLT